MFALIIPKFICHCWQYETGVSTGIIRDVSHVIIYLGSMESDLTAYYWVMYRWKSVTGKIWLREIPIGPLFTEREDCFEVVRLWSEIGLSRQASVESHIVFLSPTTTTTCLRNALLLSYFRTRRILGGWSMEMVLNKMGKFVWSVCHQGQMCSTGKTIGDENFHTMRPSFGFWWTGDIFLRRTGKCFYRGKWNIFWREYSFFFRETG